ncbi:MAG: transcriptional regulator [Acidimicrobiales bacterium]|nr:MAG: transcriptional regulator [Acidimicrobiales bacterium]
MYELEDVAARPGFRARSLRRRLFVLVGFFASLCVLAVGSYVGYTYWRLGQIPRLGGLPLSRPEEGEPENYLVVGSDSRDVVDPSDPNSGAFLGEEVEGGRRADTIMVIRVYPKGDRIEILSIQRDLWLPIGPDGEHRRINSAYGEPDGARALIRVIEEHLGIPVHHYAEVDFRGFRGLVQVIGGVPMWFDTAYRDRRTGLQIPESGCRVLGPDEALAFVRSRHLEYLGPDGRWHTDPTGDHGRISRQQIFVRNALAKGRDLARITNPRKFNELIDVALRYVKIDEHAEIGKLMAVGQRFAEFEGETIETFVLPVKDYVTPGGAAVVVLDEVRALPVLNVFKGLPRDHVDPSQVSLMVLNGSGRPGEAAAARDALTNIGFKVAGVGDLDRPRGENLERTRVRVAPGLEIFGRLVASHLRSGADLVVDPDLSESETAVVLDTGVDFAGVSPERRESRVSEERQEPDGTAGSGETTGVSVRGDVQVEQLTPPSTVVGEQPAEETDVETTTTTVIGKVPGEVPEGVECG